MAVYVVGDIHGRNDLFEALLNEINFDYKSDFMYQLGDVVNINKGAIPVIKHFMKHPGNFDMLLGNHEQYLLLNSYIKTFLINEDKRKALAKFIGVYSHISDEIHDHLFRFCKHQDFNRLKKLKAIEKWIKVSHIRRKIFDTYTKAIVDINYDENLLRQTLSLCRSTTGFFKTKKFLEECVEEDTETLTSIFEYLESREEAIDLSYQDKLFKLIHSPSVESYFGIPVLETFDIKNQICIYGHFPISKIYNDLTYKEFNDKTPLLDINVKEILSYKDALNNLYYNLDLGDNVLGALRLDDFEEFYVELLKSKRKSTSRFVVPLSNTVQKRKVGIIEKNYIIEYMHQYKRFVREKLLKPSLSFKVYASYSNYALEMIVAIDTKAKKVYYKPFYHMNLIIHFEIENWYEGQPVNEVFKKVMQEYKEVKQTDEFITREELIRYPSGREYIGEYPKFVKQIK